jgi:hypothetical protein
MSGKKNQSQSGTGPRYTKERQSQRILDKNTIPISSSSSDEEESTSLLDSLKNIISKTVSLDIVHVKDQMEKDLIDENKEKASGSKVKDSSNNDSKESEKKKDSKNNKDKLEKEKNKEKEADKEKKRDKEPDKSSDLESDHEENKKDKKMSVKREEIIKANSHGRKLGNFDKNFPLAWIESLKINAGVYVTDGDDQSENNANKEYLKAFLAAAKLNLPSNCVIVNTTYATAEHLENDILTYIQELPTRADINSKIALLNQGQMPTEKYLEKIKDLKAVVMQSEAKYASDLKFTQTQIKSITEEREQELIKQALSGLRGNYKFDLIGQSFKTIENMFMSIKTAEAQFEVNRVMKLGRQMDAQNKPNFRNQTRGNNSRGNFSRGRYNNFGNRPFVAPQYQNNNVRPQNPQNNQHMPQNGFQQSGNSQNFNVSPQHRAHHFQRGNGNSPRPPLSCFKCRGPHKARFCGLGSNVALNNMNALAEALPSTSAEKNEGTRANASNCLAVVRANPNCASFWP